MQTQYPSNIKCGFEEIEIPEGMTASLTLPSGYTETLGAGSYHFAEEA